MYVPSLMSFTYIMGEVGHADEVFESVRYGQMLDVVNDRPVLCGEVHGFTYRHPAPLGQ